MAQWYLLWIAAPLKEMFGLVYVFGSDVGAVILCWVGVLSSFLKTLLPCFGNARRSARPSRAQTKTKAVEWDSAEWEHYKKLSSGIHSMKRPLKNRSFFGEGGNHFLCRRQQNPGFGRLSQGIPGPNTLHLARVNTTCCMKRDAWIPNQTCFCSLCWLGVLWWRRTRLC